MISTTTKNAQQQWEEYAGNALSLSELKAAWDVIKKIAFDTDVHLLLQRFSAPRHEEILRLADLYAQEVYAEIETTQALYATINQEISNFEIWEGDEALLECQAYAVVYSDRIEVTANEPGLGDDLPRKSRKYIGDKCNWVWKFPLTSLAEIKACRVVDFVLKESGELA